MTSTNTRQVALVVGASRGIGRQIAVDLAKEGYAGEHL
jgi:NAD(P)-dependent dehydrogenase (short-subunit alcohol dehydrogenase family)